MSVQSSRGRSPRDTPPVDLLQDYRSQRALGFLLYVDPSPSLRRRCHRPPAVSLVHVRLDWFLMKSLSLSLACRLESSLIQSVTQTPSRPMAPNAWACVKPVSRQTARACDVRVVVGPLSLVLAKGLRRSALRRARMYSGSHAAEGRVEIL
jgi:hypothetical protein